MRVQGGTSSKWGRINRQAALAAWVDGELNWHDVIDPRLVEKLNNGRCFALVGSGPSSELGYPSWQTLAEKVAEAVASVSGSYDDVSYKAHLHKRQYAELFSQAQSDLGGRSELVRILKQLLITGGGSSRLYDLLIKWPFACYLTTNYDNEIIERLTRSGQSYRLVGNTVESFQSIRDGSSHLVVKLHGDLDNPDDAVITSGDYHEFEVEAERGYYRDKLRQIVEMFDIVIVGHSLYDPDLRLVLKTAKQTVDPSHPIYLFTADATKSDEREYLERYNIHIHSYLNADGRHAQLQSTLAVFDRYIGRREATPPSLASLSGALDQSDAAASLLLHRRLAFGSSEDTTPSQYLGPLILHTIRESTPSDQTNLATLSPLKELVFANPSLASTITSVLAEFRDNGTVLKAEGQLKLSASASAQLEKVGAERQALAAAAFEDFRSKLKANAPRVSETEVATAVARFEAIAVESFRKRGLSLASAVFTGQTVKAETLTELYRQVALSASVLSDVEAKSAFSIAAHQFLIDPSPAQKQFLEVVSQGFFLYHLIGCDPTCSALRTDIFHRIFWLVDSNVLLPRLARGCFQYDYACHLFERLGALGAQVFTTEKLAREAFEHLKWARSNTPGNPSTSSEFLATALVKGSVNQNLFIDGFIRLSADSAVVDFDEYLTLTLLGPFSFENFIRQISALGVRVLSADEITSLVLADAKDRSELESQIRAERQSRGIFKSDFQVDAEAEVMQLLGAVKRDPDKLTKPPVERAYFVSTSRVLNRISAADTAVTWSAETVYRYIQVLPGQPLNADLLQQCMLQEFYNVGTAFIDRPRYLKFFGPQIDVAKLSFEQQKELYIHALEKKGTVEEIAKSFDQTPDLEKPYFVAQMGWAVAAEAENAKARAEQIARQASQRASAAEGQVRALLSQKSEAWRKKEKRREQQNLATERNLKDPKHLRKRLKQAKKRKRKRR